MVAFPIDLLKPQNGQIVGAPPHVAITIPLEPFTIPSGGGEQIKTALVLDPVGLPSSEPDDLAERTYNFPLNPAAGYIDGSIYIAFAHHPVDVSVIRFGRRESNGLWVTLEATIHFEFEGLDDYTRTPWTCDAFLAGPGPSQPGR